LARIVVVPGAGCRYVAGYCGRSGKAERLCSTHLWFELVGLLMAVDGPILEERFEGSLLGLAIGDALGGLFEAQSADVIRARFPTVEKLVAYPQEEIWYTDDTQMAIGVGEALVERGEVVEEPLCRAFVANYAPSRGYGRGARAVLDAMEDGLDYREVAEQHFPGGSYGNGAAMRVAPVGLVFRDDHRRLWEQARLSALPTHRHPLGIEGAQLLALAVALCSGMERFDRPGFFAALLAACTSAEYRGKLEAASRVQTPDDLAGLGNRIEALHSAPTAIASFALTPESFEATVGNVILLGGDTDTLAAMAGALSGAYLGTGRLPRNLVGLLESSPKGREYIRQLAGKLFAVYRRGPEVPSGHPA
jgi:poly(ADP-ribose) glycohydrolase ARH3